MPKHYVSSEDVSVRMFENGILEKLSHVHPAVPHAIFIPVIAYMVYAASGTDLPLAAQAGLYLAGLLGWTLVEYLLHRWVFHVSQAVQAQTLATLSDQPLDRPAIAQLRGFTQKRYFIAHGVHHDFPNDSRRLVMPPGASIPLAILFYLLFRAVLGPVATPAVFAGFGTGYLVYDTLHFAVHHFPMRSRISRYLKKNHMRHHFADSGRDFGVSSPLWDFVFGTRGGSLRTDA